MKNSSKWNPSKFVYKNGVLRASRDKKEVAPSSRLMADIVAAFYEDNLKVYAKGRLLDLGCGKVPLYEAYSKHVNEAVCVDWGNSLHKNEYLDLEWDLTKPLPFGNSEFDTVVLSDVLEHIPEPELLWQEIYRVLSPNGCLIMNVPFYYGIHEAPHDFYRYTEFALKRFAANVGFDILRLDYMGGAPEILADIIAKNIRRVPLFGNTVGVFIQFITWLFVNTKLGKKISQATSESFPMGYFLVAKK